MSEPDVKLNQDPQEDKAFVDDLLEDVWPGKVEPEPVADPKPKDDGQPVGEPELEDGKPEDKGDKTEPKPVAEPKPEVKLGEEVKTWEYRGKQYTLDQLVELGILDDVVQTARQFPTIQQKYQTLLEERKAPEQSLPGAQVVQPPQQEQQPIHPDQLLQAYQPESRRMAEAGYIEPEAYEAFPRLVASLLFHRDLVYDMRNAVQVMLQREVERENTSQKTNFKGFLDGLCNEAVTGGEHYALLADPVTRNGFYEYLGTLQIPANQVNADFIKRQWVAYNSEAVIEAAKQTAVDRKQKDDKKRRDAKGEGTGTRPAPVNEPNKTGDQQLLDSFMEGSFPTGG